MSQIHDFRRQGDELLYCLLKCHVLRHPSEHVCIFAGCLCMHNITGLMDDPLERSYNREIHHSNITWKTSDVVDKGLI